MDKMVHISEKRLMVTFKVSSLASSRNSLVSASSKRVQTVANDGVHPK